MPWFTAHLIVYTRFKDGKQDVYPIFENMCLIEADNDQDAWNKARILGKEEEGDSDGTYRYGDRPAELVFAGVRKIISCEDQDHAPVHGIEVTYSELEVTTREQLEALASGEDVTVEYVE